MYEESSQQDYEVFTNQFASDQAERFSRERAMLAKMEGAAEYAAEMDALKLKFKDLFEQ